MRLNTKAYRDRQPKKEICIGFIGGLMKGIRLQLLPCSLVRSVGGRDELWSTLLDLIRSNPLLYLINKTQPNPIQQYINFQDPTQTGSTQCHQ